MIAKRDLLGSELMKEIVAIRVDTAWRMLALKEEGRLPDIDAEGATGRFDNKGGIFAPGGLIHQATNNEPIEKDLFEGAGAERFRTRVRAALRLDLVKLIYPDGMAPAVNLPNEFFAETATYIMKLKSAARRRPHTLGRRRAQSVSMQDLARSHLPAYVQPPYGSKATLSSCLAVCLAEPIIYFLACVKHYNLGLRDSERLEQQLGAALKPVRGRAGALLASSHVVVCHDTRHREGILTGITRILGYGRFGEFATFTIEEATADLRHEIDPEKEDFTPDEVVADYGGARAVAVVRLYPATTPGRRSKRVATMLVSPEKDLGLDIKKIEKEARARYGLRRRRRMKAPTTG